MSLNVEITEGELQIAYSRDGQLSATATAEALNDSDLPENLLADGLTVEKVGNRVDIREHVFSGLSLRRIKFTYRIEVPYRTEVRSVLGHGRQIVIGIMGPVTAQTSEGEIRISYVSKGVMAHVGAGNLDLQVIGEHTEARASRGNISCSRAAQGVTAEVDDGDISLMVVGPSEARVNHGTGRIDVGGVTGTLVASTDAGDLHVKAVPRDDWQLSSVSGTIRIELPLAAGFDLEASTNSGNVVINRNNSEPIAESARHVSQKANGGGKRIEVRTNSGKIIVT